MSAIAAFVSFVDPASCGPTVKRMVAAMQRRGPHGTTTNTLDHAGLGECLLHTAPQHEREPWPRTSGCGRYVLVLDGRLDDRARLASALRDSPHLTPNCGDGALLTAAYAHWGEQCVEHLVGEFVFAIWDEPRQCLFVARDPAGARSVCYHHAASGEFALASETLGVVAAGRLEPTLNDHRILDYLVEEFDRDDVVNTFVNGVSRLPAGHAMMVSLQGLKVWRYWRPATLKPLAVSSITECRDAFLEALAAATSDRARASPPIASMLSGGLDSSTVTALLARTLSNASSAPLRTITLTLADREACPDWRYAREMLGAFPGVTSTVIAAPETPAQRDTLLDELLAHAAQADDPFAAFNALTYRRVYAAARDAGCGVVFDGMAGDLCFLSPEATAAMLGARGELLALRAVATCYAWHEASALEGVGVWARSFAAGHLSPSARAWLRARRDRHHLRSGDLAALKPDRARAYLAMRRGADYHAGVRSTDGSSQTVMSNHFTRGLLSFAHETYGQAALNLGVEPRSPFSDRRVMELAIRLPFAAQAALPNYKHLLRSATQGLLPDAVRERRSIGGHPGWAHFDGAAQALNARCGDGHGSAWWNAVAEWLDLEARERAPDEDQISRRRRTLRAYVLSQWIANYQTRCQQAMQRCE